MPAKKHILNFSKNSTSVMFGISSVLEEFAFLQLLQKEMNIYLSIREQVTNEVSSKKIISYSVYSFYDEEKQISYDLIANKTEFGPIVDFLDNISYIFRCTADYIEIEEDRIQSQLASLEQILFVQKMKEDMFTKKQNAVLYNAFYI